MVIYLRHRIHGTKVAVSTQEAEQDKLNGWEEYDPVVPVKDAQNVTQIRLGKGKSEWRQSNK